MQGSVATPLTNERNYTADALRGLAAVVVVGSHFQSLIESARFPAAEAFQSSVGETLRYLCRGSSLYFFVISGFILGGKIPIWSRRSAGLFLRTLQRQTRIAIVFWVAMLIIGLANLVKLWITAKPWYSLSVQEFLAQFFFVANVTELNQQRLIPPAWYLEADIVLVFGAVVFYWFWNQLPAERRAPWKGPIWLGSIILTILSLKVQTFFPMGHGPEAPFRGLAYFMLGLLAWHAASNRAAFAGLLINSVLILWWTDNSALSRYLSTSGSLIVAWLLCISQRNTMAQEFFSHPVFKFFNKMNFSLFLLHYFLLTVAVSVARNVSPGSMAGLIIIMTMALGFVLGLAHVFHYRVEKPLLRWHDDVWNRYLLPETSGRIEEKPIRSMPGLVQAR